MAGSRVNVTLGFNADTTQAQQAIKQLNTQLASIQNLKLDNLGINQQIVDAADAAKTLQTALQAAFNVDTGKINTTQFAQQLKLAGTNVTELGSRLAQLGPQGTAAFVSLSKSISLMDVPLKQTNTTLTKMMTTLKNTAKWELSSKAIHGIESAFSNALNYVQDLNEALTDIRVVSNASVEDMTKFATQANVAAKALGTTTKEYAKAALTYYQQGDSADLAAKKAEITLKATNVAFKATAQEMSDMLTSTWNGFQAGADELEHYVDVMANLGSHTASSVEEIATALQKVAATANTVGMSMEQVSAMIATVSSTTRQAASTVGTAMNTILSRFESLKLGETLEDGLDLTKYTKALKTIGVNVLDINGELRSMGDVVDDIMNKWQTLSDGQKTALANTVGGVRQYTNIMALFNNQQKYQENLAYAQNSDGALEKMQSTYMTGIEAAKKKLQATKEGLWSDLIDEQTILNGTKALTGFIEQVQNLMTSLGGIKGVATTLGGILTTVFSKQIGASISNAITKIQTFNSSFTGIKGNNAFQTGLMRTTSLFTQNTNQRIYEQQNAELQSGLKDFRSGVSQDLGTSAQLESAQILLEKKQQLLAVENELSQTQKQAAQAQITNLQAEATQVEQVSQQYQQQQAAVKEAKKHLFDNSDLSRGDAQQQYESRKLAQQQMHDDLKNGAISQASISGGAFGNLITNQFNGLDQMVDRVDRLNQVSKICTDSLSRLGDIDFSKVQQGSTELDRIKQELQDMQALFESLGADQAAAKMKSLLEGLNSGDITTFKTTLDEVEQSISKLGSGSMASVSEIAKIFANAFNLPEDELTEFLNCSDNAADGAQKLIQKMREMAGLAGSTQFQSGGLTKGIQTLARGIGSAVMQFSTLSNLTANWDTSNLTSKITGIGMAFSNIMSNFGNWPAMIMSAVGAAAGILIGKLEQQQKQYDQWVKDQKKEIEEFTVLTDEEKEEMATNNELMQSYADLYDQKLQGADVDAQLIAEGMKLIQHFQLEGAELELLAGNYEKVAEKAREAAKAEAERNLGSLETKRQTKERLVSQMGAEGVLRQDEKLSFMAPTDATQVSRAGPATGAHNLNTTLADNNIQVIRTDQGYIVTSGALTGYGGFGGYQEYSYTTDAIENNSRYAQESGVVSYHTGRESGFTTADTLQFKLPGNAQEMADYGSYLLDSPLAPYLLQTYAPGMTSQPFSGGYYNLLVSKSGDSAAYRRQVYEALDATIEQMVEDGKHLDKSGQQTEGFNTLVKIRDEWKVQMEQLDAAWAEARDAVDELNRSELIGRSKSSSWADYKATKANIAANYTKYGQYLDIEPGTEEHAAEDFMIENSEMAYHVAVDRMIEDQASTIDDPELQKKFRETTEKYIDAYGVESINTYALQHIRQNYNTEGYDVVNDEQLRGLSASTEGLITQTDTFTEKITKAKQALKQGLTGDEFISTMQNVLTWGENGIKSFNDFMQMSYEEQVAYLDKVERDYKRTQTKTSADQLAATRLAQKEAQTAYDQFLEENQITQEGMTQLIGQKTYYTTAANWKGIIDSVWGDMSSTGRNMFNDMQELYETKYKEEGGPESVEDWYKAQNETIQADFQRDYFTNGEYQRAFLGGFTAEGIQQYETLQSGLISDETIADMEQLFNASMLSEFNARLLDTKNDMTELSNIISNGPSSVSDWELLGRVLDEDFETLQGLSDLELSKKIQEALQAPITYMTPEELQAQYVESYTSDGGRTYSAWQIGDWVYDASEYTAEQAEADFLAANPDIVIATAEQKAVLEWQRKKTLETVNTNIQNEEIKKDAADLAKQEEQLTQLQNAYKEFVTNGKLSTKTVSALEKLGIKPESYKDLDSLSSAISKTQKQMEKTRDSLKKKLNVNGFTGSLEDAQLSWEEFKEKYSLKDDTFQETFNQWKQAFWDVRTAYDDWNEAALKAQDQITKSVNAQKLSQEKLSDQYTKLKSVSDDVTKAFTNNEQLSTSTLKKLKEQGVEWQKGQQANVANYGKVLGNTAVAQQQMLQGQKYNASQINPFEYWDGSARDRFYSGKKWQTITHDTDLTALGLDEEETVKISLDLAGGNGRIAEQIQSEIQAAKAAGQSITWDDIIGKLNAKDLDIDEQIAGIWDGFMQSGISAVQAVLGEHQAAAAQIVSLWTQAFQAIAAAQTTFAKGLNLNYDSDENTLATQASLMFGVKDQSGQQMFSYDDVMTLLSGGTITKGDQTYNAERVMGMANNQMTLPTGYEWAMSQKDNYPANFLYSSTSNTDKNGHALTTPRMLEANEQGRRAESGAEMLTNAKDFISANLGSYISGLKGAAKTAFEEAETKARQEQGDNFNYTQWATDYLLHTWFGEAADDPQKMQELFIRTIGQEAGYFSSIEGQKQKNAESTVKAGLQDSEIQKNYSTQIEKEQKIQQAIEKAQSLKLSGKNLGTNLSAEEQKYVLQATGKSDIADVSLGDLSSAASNSANALYGLATAAQAAAEAEAEKQGFTKNAQTGQWYYHERRTAAEMQDQDTTGWTQQSDGSWLKDEATLANNEFQTMMQGFTDNTNAAKEAVANFVNNQLSMYADALGETIDTIGSYCEAIAMANGVQLDWNSLTDESKLLMAEAALRFKETSEAIESINSLGAEDGLVQALLGTAKQSVLDGMTLQDTADAYKQIVEAVNGLYGADVVDASFFNAATEAGKAHLELLEQIAEGGEKAAEAIEKLEREIIKTFNEDNNLGFTEDEINSLNEFANGLKYGEDLTQEQLDWINNFAQLHHLTEAQLKALGEILGLTMDIEQETVKVPKDIKGINDALAKVKSNTSSSGEKAANLAAAWTAIKKGVKDGSIAAGEFDDAMKDAWKTISQDPQALSDLAELLGPEGMIELTAKVTDIELPDGWDDMDIEAKVKYLADMGAIEGLTFDQDGTIHYSVEGADISMHAETEESDSTTSGQSTSSISGFIHVPEGPTLEWSGEMTTVSEGNGGTVASFPVLDGAKVTKATNNRGNNSNTGGRRGGGGGGGGRRTKQKKDDHDRTRYHQTDRQLKKQNDLLTKNDKLKSRKYGSGYLDSLKAENKELKNQIDLNKEKIKEAQKYLEKDKKELEQNGATFDEDGNIDYDAYEKKWQDEYNRMVDQYNNGAMDDDEWTEFQRKYDNAMDAVERYEEAQDRIAEAQEEILEAQNQISANKLEMVTYELELKVELDQRQIDLLQTMLKLYENDLDKSSKLLTNYIEQMRLLQHQSNAAPEALANLMSQAGISSLDNIKQDKDGFIIPTVDGFDGDKMTVKDFAEGLKSIADQAQSSLDAIIEMRETMLSFYGDVIDKGEEKFSALANTMKHLNNMMSGYLELVDLYNTGGDVWDKKATIMEAQYDTQLQTIDMYEARMKLYQQQETELEAELQKDPTNEAAKRALEDLKETKEQAEEEWLDAVKTAAQTAKDLYQNSVDEIMDQMNKLNGDDMDWLKTKADLWKQNNDLYVDEVTKIYEVDKLTRKIEDSIADTRSKSNQAELKALKEKIKLQADSNELSEYDIEMMNKEYELLLAKQELENAKDAKNQVRLTRDENGNMIYQYTTDQDAVSEAEQKYNDVLYEMHKTSKEHLNDLYENLQETEEAYRAAVEQIWNDATLTAEEKQQRLDEVNEAYGKILDNLGSQIEITYGNLTDYDTRLSNRFAEELKGTAFDTDKYLNTTLVAMSKKADDFKQGMINCQTALVGALDSYSNRVDSLQEHTHTKWEDMTSDLGKFKTAATNTKNETDKLIETLKKSLEDAMTRIIKDFKNWNSEIEKTIKNLSSMIDKINAVLTALASLGDDRRDGGRRDGDDGRRDGDDGRRDGGRRDGDDGRRDGGDDRRGGGGTRLSGWKYDATHHWRQNLDTGAIVQKAAHTYSGPITNGTKCTVCGRQVTAYTPKSYNPDPSPTQTQQPTSSGTKPKVDSRVRVPGSVRAATGGLIDYTGPAWVDGTEPNPEYVLNADQTKMMFGILSSGVMDKLLNALIYAAQAMSMTSLNANNLANSYTSALSDASSSVQQTVYVKADFPAATDKQEIVSALTEIYNKTSHYVNRQTTVGL